MQETLVQPMDEYGRALERRPDPGTTWALAVPRLEILNLHGRAALLGDRNLSGVRSTRGNVRRRQRASVVHHRAAGVGRNLAFHYSPAGSGDPPAASPP